MSRPFRTLVRKALMWATNRLLKKVLSDYRVQERQKALVWLANTILDSLRDRKIDDAEWTRIQDAFRRLTGR